MTREEQLKYCTICTRRAFDATTGVICSLSGAPAAFENNCPDFDRDLTALVQQATNENSTLPQNAQNTLSAEAYENLRLEQNLPVGLLAAVAAGLLGAVLWGAITVATGFQIGYMALAIGAGVGVAMRFFGKGLDMVFGIVGAVVSLLSCLLGNLFSIVGFIANSEGYGYFEVLGMLDFSLVTELMSATFSPIDLLFYGLAVYTGYRFSFRKVNAA